MKPRIYTDVKPRIRTDINQGFLSVLVHHIRFDQWFHISQPLSVVRPHQALELWLGTKIQDHAHFNFRGLEIVHQLRHENLVYGICHLLFNDDKPFDYYVGPVITHFLAVIKNLKLLLLRYAKPHAAHLECECVFVYFFEEAKAKCVVNVVEGSQDFIRYVFVQQLVRHRNLLWEAFLSAQIRGFASAQIRGFICAWANSPDSRTTDTPRARPPETA